MHKKGKLSELAVGLASLMSCLILVAPVHPQTQPAAGRRPQVKLIYGALTAANGPFWLAADQGLFEKHGLDVQVIHRQLSSCSPKRQ